MRYILTENPYIICRFTTGDTVTIDIYDLSDDSKTIDGASMSEIGTTGYFKYQFNPSPTSLTEYIYIATNTTEEHAGKIIIGGYPDGIKDQTDKMNFTSTDIKATLDGEEVTTDSASRTGSKADVTNLDVAVSSRNATTPPTTSEIKTAIEAAGSSIASILEDTSDLQTNQNAWLTADITALALESSLNDIKGATFDGGTDSLESIRDRGDDAWVTGAGVSAPTVEDIRTEMDTNSVKMAPSQNLADYKADVTNLDVAVSTRNDTTPPTTSEIKTAIEAAGSSISSILEDTNDLQTNQDAWLTADITALALEASLTSMKGATFAESTDSLEAIRDRGDDAWVTGAGGSSPTVEDIRTEMEGTGHTLATIEYNLDKHDQVIKGLIL